MEMFIVNNKWSKKGGSQVYETFQQREYKMWRHNICIEGFEFQWSKNNNLGQYISINIL